VVIAIGIALGLAYEPSAPPPEPRASAPDGWIATLRLRDLASETDIAKRKRRFVGLVLPLILAENDAILAARQAVEGYRATLAEGRVPSRAERRLIAHLMERYDARDPADLAARVDIVPPSLALAQAAIESGWGTSRFAREGNALFGERTWSTGLGLVPTARADNATFEVRTFATLAHAVRSYMNNLNSNEAYAPFRAARAALRDEARGIDGASLVWTLGGYSEQGDDYVALVHAVMRDNDLARLDGAATRVAAREQSAPWEPGRSMMERSG
jgi:Bax protein